MEKKRIEGDVSELLSCQVDSWGCCVKADCIVDTDVHCVSVEGVETVATVDTDPLYTPWLTHPDNRQMDRGREITLIQSSKETFDA